MEIHREWAQSPHAFAYVSAPYRRATDNYRFGECAGCHAPTPMLTLTEPEPRAAERELGVTCGTCHLDHGAMVGPIEPSGFVKPHPIKVDPTLFKDGVLCGRCHQSTLAQWKASQVQEKQGCGQCHMPAIRRKMTQETSLISKPIVAAESPTVEHRHVFTLIPTNQPKSAFDLSAKVVAGELSVTLENFLPHDLPTGDFGMRVVQVTVRAIDTSGRETVAAKWEVTGIVGGAIPSGSSRHWQVVLPRDVKRLKLEMDRRGRDSADQLPLLRKEVLFP